MKTNSLKLRTTTLLSKFWLCMGVLFLTASFSPDLLAQKGKDDGGGEGKQYRGVRVTQGLLDFESKETFETIYNDLEKRIVAAAKDGTLDNDERGDEIEDNLILADFESTLRGFKSLRLAELTKEFNFLDRGGDPEKYDEDDLVVDEIIGAFLSTDKTMKIGTSIYYLPYDGAGLEITDGSFATLEALKNGKSPLLFKKIKVIGDEEEGCSASFVANGSSTGLNYGFTFTGHPTPGSAPDATVNYHWTFGDGSTASTKNATHTYSSPGTYEVCVMVEKIHPKGGYCSDMFCKSITIEEEDPVDTTATCIGAAAFAWNETGTAGELCFSPLGGIYYSNIVSYSWTFGDGNTSTDINACNTYACDLDNVWVSLTVVLDNGCSSTISLPVNITSNNCCERNAKSQGTEHYASNYKFTWKQKSSHFLWWFNKIVVKMTHYKHNGNKWKKNKKDLKATTYGFVYTEDAAGCGCENDYNIGATEIEYNSKKLTLKKKITKKYKTRKDAEWSVKYYINNGLKLDTQTSVACD